MTDAGPSITKEYIKDVLGPPADLNRPPLKFEKFVANDFLKWIVSLEKTDGKKPGSSTVSTHRSAVVFLFSEFKAVMSLALQTELKDLYKGLKKQIAQQISNGIDFTLYRWLAEEMLVDNEPSAVFGHAVLTTSWNLMCRIGNAVAICDTHLEWIGDSLGIYFAHTKTDQTGDRPRDPRHVYANPLMPEICPILSLAIYFLCFPVDPDTRQIFGGGNQDDRYRRLLTRVLGTEEASGELEARGVQKENIGPHSSRKGSTSLCASGTTACPSSIAVNLRAGWTVGDVQDTYLRYQVCFHSKRKNFTRT